MATWVQARLRVLAQRLARYRQQQQHVGDKPLPLATKLLAAHLDDPSSGKIRGKEGYLKLRPDRVALQDASAQTALLQFMLTKRPATAVPTSIHCDHLIVGSSDGREDDLERAIAENREVFDFLQSASCKYGIDFWPPGSGIIHQIVLENYAFPGALMIGCDSHTPNAGGLGSLAVGVGGADAVDVMSGQPWEVKAPRIMGVHLKGQLSSWVSAKDIILHVAGRLSVKGGTGFIVEYFGDGVNSLSCTGMATICNMGAEIGATTSVFPYTPQHQAYLEAMGRNDVREEADKHMHMLTPDPECEYDSVLEVDLSSLEPHVNGPFSPDAATPLSMLAGKAQMEQWPTQLSACLIGSCTNSSYEDMTRSADVVRQAVAAGLTLKTPLFVTPGSDQIYQTCKRDGLLDVFENAGATVLANACGPCIGQWDRSSATVAQNKDMGSNTIMTSFNRNFAGRNDGNNRTLNLLASPELVTMFAFIGNIHSNPCTDPITQRAHSTASTATTATTSATTADPSLPPPSPAAPSASFRFSPPQGLTFSPQGVAAPERSAEQYSGDASAELSIAPNSERLEALQPFAPWHGSDFHNLRVLIKVKGKCTTDDISAAGPWLKYKGHLSNISHNTLITAVNADTGERNRVANHLRPGAPGAVPDVARAYRDAGVGWVVIGDENYGEGSAREHAAMQPRFLGGVAVICRSFARIHETNLKKQGMLPLTFADAADYNRVPSDALLDIVGFGTADADGGGAFGPDTQLSLVVRNGETGELMDTLPLKHTFSADQAEWFRAGSALNHIAQQQ